LKFELDK